MELKLQLIAKTVLESKGHANEEIVVFEAILGLWFIDYGIPGMGTLTTNKI